ncbi:single-stranded DNA-binding protein [Pyramidobacter sp. C12-8]|uniref:single-stranded DNA-binding protein n=1 Tax=Pyramidobacter sp. C12-8 TaxID=1943580 RepID=UPI00098FA4E4|nr:single-stranded DNA-binding protein [Pyramidobacter sp. C12-8]OON89629.1 hypothetical protein B0D78_01980 [Pyramidobacter sp. C12-8]
MARGFNKAILIGNLARDPELRRVNGDSSVASMTLAVNRSRTGKDGQRIDECDFIPVVVWGAMAVNVEKYLSKGSSCLVEGRIQVRNYEDAQGQKRYVTEVVASAVQFLGSPKGRESREGTCEAPQRPRTQEPRYEAEAENFDRRESAADFCEEADIPF